MVWAAYLGLAITSVTQFYFGKVCVKHPELKGKRYRASTGDCVACAKMRARIFYEKDLAHSRNVRIKWAEENREKVLAYYRCKHETNRERANARRREWTRKNPERAAAKARELYLKNREYRLAKVHEYYRKNKDYILAYARMKRQVKEKERHAYSK